MRRAHDEETHFCRMGLRDNLCGLEEFELPFGFVDTTDDTNYRVGTSAKPASESVVAMPALEHFAVGTIIGLYYSFGVYAGFHEISNDPCGDSYNKVSANAFVLAHVPAGYGGADVKH